MVFLNAKSELWDLKKKVTQNARFHTFYLSNIWVYAVEIIQQIADTNKMYIILMHITYFILLII
jgi:hypothetical protein